MADGATAGVGVTVGIRVGIGVGINPGAGVGVGLCPGANVGAGLCVGVGVGVFPDGVATNAGTSPACTTKFLVRVLVIPVASNHEIVIECAPSESGTGGL